MNKKFWKYLPALALAIVSVLAAGLLNADSWLHASNGEESTQQETVTTAPETEQGTTTTQTLELPPMAEETQETADAETEPSQETTEAAEETTEVTEAPEETAEETEAPEETTEETTEATEPAEETTEATEETVEPTEEAAPAITVTAVGYSGIYDGKNHYASYTVSDPVGTTITYSLDGGATWSATVPSIKDVAVITFLVKAENPGYETAISTGTLEVTPATITISTTGAKKVYNGQPLYSSGIKVTGLVAGEYLNCYATGSRTDVGQGKNVYLINWFDSTAKFKNYTIVNDYGILEITPATLTVTTYSGSKVYNGEPLTAGGMISGFIWGETATFTITGEQTEEGTSDNTYELVFDGTAKAENYIINEKLGTLTVTAP